MDQLPIWAQWLSPIGVMVGLVTIVFGAVAAWFKIVRRLDRIEHSIEQIRVQGNGHLSIIGSLVTALNRRGVISAEEFGSIIQNFVSIGGVIPPNPLSPDEQRRLSYYLELARGGLRHPGWRCGAAQLDPADLPGGK